MKSELDTLYNDKFFAGRARWAWRAPIMCESLVIIFKDLFGEPPYRVIDLGCAIGDLVSGFRAAGVDAYGVEGSMCARPHIVCQPDRWICADLREPLTLDLGTFDFVTCFEVAEHLEKEFADQFVDNVTSLSDVIVMSACPPHPTKPVSYLHPNEQPYEYWDKKFGDKGYKRVPVMEAYIKDSWFPWSKKYGVASLYSHLLCYSKRPPVLEPLHD